MDRIDIGLDAAAEKALLAYEWPGNVRELANVLERTLSRMEGNMIHLEYLPFFISGRQNRSVFEMPTSIRKLQEKAEKDAIVDCLMAYDYNKAKVARALGIHRTQLYKKPNMAFRCTGPFRPRECGYGRIQRNVKPGLKWRTGCLNSLRNSGGMLGLTL